MKILYPDYTNSIVNLVSSILRSYNVVEDHPPLKQIDINSLRKQKNIVLFILDGFGMNLLRQYSNELDLFKHKLVSPITSVFPSTTSAAITSIITGKTPWEHGAIGWTLYFKEFAKNIDFLPNWDSITSKTQDPNEYNITDLVGADNIFNKVAKVNSKVEQFYLTHEDLSTSYNVVLNSGPSKILPYKNVTELFKTLVELLSQPTGNKKFIYVYSSSPDKLEHQYGVYSDEVKSFVIRINKELQSLSTKLEGSDSTILITADHGLIDMKNYYYTNEDTELFDCMILPTFPEPRFISFFVKKHKIDKFENIIEKYKKDFLFFEREEFIKLGLLGKGKMHSKIDDFLGDYLAIAISDSAMKSIYMQNGKWKKEFEAHHAGITEGEMQVPLIKIDC